MKIIKLILASVFCLLLTVNAKAQFLEKMGQKAMKKVEREAEKRTERRIDRGIDKTFDKAEEKIDGTVKGDNKNTKEKNDKQVNNTQRAGDNIENSPVENETAVDSPEQSPSVINWAKYDFVPGTEIIFEDNHEGEQNGEFPSKWNLVSGTIENANFNGENMIYFLETGNFPNGIVPLLKEPSADYLPDEFTVEFDAYYEKGQFNNIFTVHFYDAKNKLQKRINDGFIDFYINGAKYAHTQTEKKLGGAKAIHVDRNNSHWRHIGISFNKRALKVYMDDTRLLNIPNIEFNPTGITIATNHSNEEHKQFIKNIRIAKGAVPLYDKVLTDGKFITTGIKFDVNKATIKPESAGTINYVFKMMQDNPDLRFCVEGHTDSDGSDAANQTLSEKRAEAVRAELIRLGISANRLTSKGWGESKPMTGNDTPEGKAQNRRVEFVKL